MPGIPKIDSIWRFLSQQILGEEKFAIPPKFCRRETRKDAKTFCCICWYISKSRPPCFRSRKNRCWCIFNIWKWFMWFDCAHFGMKFFKIRFLQNIVNNNIASSKVILYSIFGDILQIFLKLNKRTNVVSISWCNKKKGDSGHKNTF